MAKFATKMIDVARQVTSFTFTGKPKRDFDYKALPDHIKIQLGCHGLGQKLHDSFNKATSVSEAEQNAEDLYAALMRGDWSVSGGVTGIWAQALARALEIELVKAQGIWKEASDDEKKRLKKHPGLLLAKNEIEREALELKEGPKDDILESLLK